MKFGIYGDLVNQAFSQFNESLINSQDEDSLIENEISGAEYANENDSEKRETSNFFAIPNFIPQILPDDEVAEGINSLNSEQKKVFHVVHTWTNDYVKYDSHNVEPIHLFQAMDLLVNLIHCAILKNCFNTIKTQKNQDFFILGPTGISVVAIGETTIHSGFGINPATKLFGFWFKYHI